MIRALPGYTWETAEEITMPQLQCIRADLDEFPPTHVSIALALKALGVNSSKPGTRQPRGMLRRPASPAMNAFVDALVTRDVINPSLILSEN